MNNVIKIGQIGIGDDPYTAADFEAELALADPSQPLTLDIHSEGGSVWEGFRMYNLAKEWTGPIVGRVQCAAFSIASYLLMACDEIEIADNGWIMIHNPYAAAEGDATELAKNANLLADLREKMVVAYSERTGLPPGAVGDMMDNEVYLGAEQAIEMGFANRTIDHVAAPRALQPQASAKRSNSLPVAVLASLYGRTPGNDQPAAEPKEDTVPKEILTPKMIRRSFPNASDGFIIKCMDDEMAMEDVGKEYANEMAGDNASLKDQLAAAMQENAELKEQMAMMNPSAMDPNAMDDEMYDGEMAMDDMAMDANAYHNPGEDLGGGGSRGPHARQAARVPQARRRVNPAARQTRRANVPGLAPVAGAGGNSAPVDPTKEFNKIVEEFKAKGHSPARALILANQQAPKLRAAHVEAYNRNRVAVR